MHLDSMPQLIPFFLIAFLCYPRHASVLGRLSDKYGRKPFVVLGTVGTTIMDFLVYLNPTSLNFLMAKISISTMTNTATVTSVRAALSDKLSGKSLGVANAKVGIFAGLAVIVGPLMGTLLQSRVGDANVYLAAALVGCLNILNLQSRFKESLAEDNRKEMDWAAANPTSFTKLLTCSSEASMCSYSLGLQCIAEPRFVFPFASIAWETLHKYDPLTRGRFASFFGVVYVAGAIVAKGRMKALGPKGHITESNIANLIGFLIWSFRHDSLGTYMAIFCMALGIRKRDGLEVLLMKQGGGQGWGKGETYGYIANFKSLSAVAAPLIMGQAFAYSTSNGRSFYGSPMLVAAVATALSELCFQSVKDRCATE